MEMQWDRHLTVGREIRSLVRSPARGDATSNGHHALRACEQAKHPPKSPSGWAQQVKSSPDKPPTPPGDRFSKLFLSSEPFEVLAALELINQPLPKLCTLLIALSRLEVQSLGTRTEWPLRTLSPCTIGSTFCFVGYRKLL